ncbi:MAG: LysR family transcriptional regulator [Clostridia bacterium]|nr:LysR family transcriptional regulator [Clostridia bacterium]
MNILHLKYAVEVARAGSINKASDVLMIAQPNLSRAIKELESDLGITIFDRSAKGMMVTPEGEEFLGYAKKILDQIDDVESLYKNGAPAKQKFSISVPRVSYIAEAFAQFSMKITADPAEIFYKETNALHAINNIFLYDYKLGIVRYAEQYDRYFKDLLDEKGLQYDHVTDFTYKLIMHRSSPLAQLDCIRFSDLLSHIEIAHADPYVPSLPFAEVKKEELPEDIQRRIFVFERGTQFDLLAANSETFMWVSPVPEKLLNRYELVQKECADHDRIYRDLLIYRKDYRFSKLDRMFVDELYAAREQYL